MTVDEAREALFDAVRDYGNAIRAVNNGRATFVAIDHAWGVLHTREAAFVAAVRADECEKVARAEKEPRFRLDDALNWKRPGVSEEQVTSYKTAILRMRR